MEKDPSNLEKRKENSKKTLTNKRQVIQYSFISIQFPWIYKTLAKTRCKCFELFASVKRVYIFGIYIFTPQRFNTEIINEEQCSLSHQLS